MILDSGHRHIDDFYSKKELNEFLGIGSENAFWVNMFFEGDNMNKTYVSTTVENVDGTDHAQIYSLGIPYKLGDYKLYGIELEIGIFDADANDYVDRVRMRGNTYNSLSTLNLDDTTNRTSQGSYSYTFTADDFSGYDKIFLYMNTVVTGAKELLISYVKIKVYYDE